MVNSLFSALEPMLRRVVYMLSLIIILCVDHNTSSQGYHITDMCTQA